MGTLPNENVPGARLGTLLGGKYRVVRELARGGMGTVVIATHLKLDRPVAIKLLSVAGKDPAYVAARFQREARAAARLSGDHVVRILDLDETADGTPYLVMELLEGLDLEQVLGTEGAVAPARAVNWALQACAALAEAHARGIVHRDVKPSNLFRVLRADGSELIKLLDFGISKLVDDEVQLTRTATALGSPMFMSPEQLLSPRLVDRRSDVWSLGVTLFRLLCNRAPFDASDASSLAAQIAAQPPTALQPLAPGVPAALCAVVMRCLEKEAAQRWPTVVALAEALEPFRAADGLGSLSEVRRAEAQALANVTAAPVAAPAPVTNQNATLSHDLPPVPAALLRPTVSAVVPLPVAPLPARRSLGVPAAIAAAVVAAAGALFVATRPAAEPERSVPSVVAEAPAPVAAVPEPADPGRPDAGAVARARPARPTAAAKNPADLELK